MDDTSNPPARVVSGEGPGATAATAAILLALLLSIFAGSGWATATIL